MISTLVIPTYRRPDYLRGALESIARSKGVSAGCVEILVVDNNSQDITPDIVKEFSIAHPELCVRYVLEPQQGLAFARNRGLQDACGKWIAYMDDDQEIAPDYLARLPDAFSESSAQCVGGKIIYKNAEDIPRWLVPLIANVGQLDLGDDVLFFDGRTRFLKGGNFAFDRDVLLAVGGFDSRLGRVAGNLMGAEDDEVQSRIVAAGHSVAYCPSLVQYNWLLPDKFEKRYWRRHAYWYGRTSYRTSEAGWRAAICWFGVPRSLYFQLLKDVLHYCTTLISFNGVRMFQRERSILETLGSMVEARQGRRI